MGKQIVVFLLRVVLGLVGGYLLSWLFFAKAGKVDWVIALILGALVVVAAYASEGWRKSRGK
jgi:uncharacterized membrane protein YeaQ/YmgE (transglycosylase-associated protein family)